MRIVLMITGLICLVLGTVGILLPLFPTTPFYLVAAFCFSRASVKLHQWFLSTGLYKKHLMTWVEGKEMSLKSKVRVMLWVTLLLGIGFALAMGRMAVQVILSVVWFLHMFYFMFRVKTAEKAQ